jgi:prophage regulatory protein
MPRSELAIQTKENPLSPVHTTAATEATAPKKRGEKNPQPLHVAHVNDALLKLSVVRQLTGMSTSTLYRKAASDPTFPRLIKLGTRCTRISSVSLSAWIAAQAKG